MSKPDNLTELSQRHFYTDSVTGERVYIGLAEAERDLITAIYCLTHDAAVEEPADSMRFSQSALNLAHTLQIVKSLNNE